jgi:hypothetical protein
MLEKNRKNPAAVALGRLKGLAHRKTMKLPKGEKNPNAVLLGRLGGLKAAGAGGFARAANLTARELTKSAKKAANARWKKYRNRIKADKPSIG